MSESGTTETTQATTQPMQTTEPSRLNQTFAVPADRKMAYIVKIEKLHPVVFQDGTTADNIVLAIFDGYQCIVKKNEMNVGDLAVYFTIDSIPDPDNPDTAFLAERGGRVKQMKLRGVESQGLLGPISWLEHVVGDVSDYVEGEDITSELKVTKYVRPEEQNSYTSVRVNSDGKPVHSSRFTFPEFVPKTDELNIQSYSKMLKSIVGRKTVVTWKKDGSSVTIFKNGDKIGVCSRNYEITRGDLSCENFFRVVEKYNIEEKLKQFGKNIAIQGEMVGPGVNGNREGLKELDFFVFNIFDIDAHHYLTHQNVQSICEELKLKMVPVLFPINSDDFSLYDGQFSNTFPSALQKFESETDGKIADINYLKNYAKSLKYANGSPAEGFVVKTADDNVSEGKHRFSFKTISPDHIEAVESGWKKPSVKTNSKPSSGGKFKACERKEVKKSATSDKSEDNSKAIEFTAQSVVSVISAEPAEPIEQTTDSFTEGMLEQMKSKTFTVKFESKAQANVFCDILKSVLHTVKIDHVGDDSIKKTDDVSE